MSTPFGVFCYYFFGVFDMLRLKELRQDNDLTQLYCSQIAYISKNSYIRYENEERVPPSDVIISFAQYYKTSTDYILGLTDISKPYPRKK